MSFKLIFTIIFTKAFGFFGYLAVSLPVLSLTRRRGSTLPQPDPFFWSPPVWKLSIFWKMTKLTQNTNCLSQPDWKKQWWKLELRRAKLSNCSWDYNNDQGSSFFVHANWHHIQSTKRNLLRGFSLRLFLLVVLIWFNCKIWLQILLMGQTETPVSNFSEHCIIDSTG